MLQLNLVGNRPPVARASRQVVRAQNTNPVPRDGREANIQRIFNDLNAGAKDTGLLKEVYTENVWFQDPLLLPDGLKGQKALKAYHDKLNGMTTEFDTKIHQIVRDGDSAVVLWRAKASVAVKVPPMPAVKINQVEYEGASLLKFSPGEAKISDHVDYYNELPMYEKMPLLGKILQFAKKISKEHMLKDLPGSET